MEVFDRLVEPLKAPSADLSCLTEVAIRSGDSRTRTVAGSFSDITHGLHPVHVRRAWCSSHKVGATFLKPKTLTSVWGLSTIEWDCGLQDSAALAKGQAWGDL